MFTLSNPPAASEILHAIQSLSNLVYLAKMDAGNKAKVLINIPLTEVDMEIGAFYRFSCEDYPKIRELLAEFGCSPPIVPDDFILHLQENLLWRKTTPTVGENGGIRCGLEVFLDLGEDEGVLLTTFWAWDDDIHRTTGAGESREGALCQRFNLQPLPCTPFWEPLVANLAEGLAPEGVDGCSNAQQN